MLDHLARRFRLRGFDVKVLIREIVLSRTYRQGSQVSSERLERDPQNVWFARQSAHRIEAEFLRDALLRVSGLLVRELHGKSARPYQPAGYYRELNFPKRKYVSDQGVEQYRRGLYTHWQRTFVHPALLAFDAPSREACVADRAHSATPQQALTLLNDPSSIEAAVALAAPGARASGIIGRGNASIERTHA